MLEFKEENIKYLACTLPSEIAHFRDIGDFDGELRAIAKLRERKIPEFLRLRLLIEEAIANEMRRDYKMSFDELLVGVRKKYPFCTPQMLTEIVERGHADYIYRGTERFFQNSAVSNVCNEEVRFFSGVISGREPAPVYNELRREHRRIMLEKGYHAVRYRIREELAPDIVERDGRRIRVHLPYPAITPEQTDIVLHSSSHPVRISDASQRTAFIECEDKHGAVYSVDFSYTVRMPYVSLDPAAVSAEQPSFYLGEQYPHVVFTPAIRAAARELKGNETNPLILARRAYDFVTENVTYSYMRTYLAIENIPEFALLNGRGDCGVMSLLFITLCRAMGVSARWQSGSHVRPNAIGSHDWAQFYVAPYGWLYADPSFGGGAREMGDDEMWNHYFGNLDCLREINNTEFQTPFDPPKKFMRDDPYDNQRGEAEYEDYGLDYNELDCRRFVVEAKNVD